MALDIYGGDPVVIATRDEILRCSAALQIAISEARAAIFSLSPSVLDRLPNPLPNFQLAFLLPGFLERLSGLSSKLQIAAEGYFSRESQISHQLSGVLEPIGLVLSIVRISTPFSHLAATELLGMSAALAVVGLAGPPSAAKTQLIGQAVQMAPLGFGFQSHQELLGSGQATASALGLGVASGSARLLLTAPTYAPRSLQDLANRLKFAYGNPASSIRIEAYPISTGRQLIVYVPGTQNFQLRGNNPLNISSNFSAMGRNSQAPSEMAVSKALQEAGAGRGDRVLFVGHSQGALVSGNLATSIQPFQVSGLVSFGGPIAHLNLEVPTIAIENAADPVPSLSGNTNPLRENWVTVSNDGSFEDLVSAHAMQGYQDCAVETDASTNPGLTRIRDQIFDGVVGPGKEYVFEISRN